MMLSTRKISTIRPVTSQSYFWLHFEDKRQNLMALRDPIKQWTIRKEKLKIKAYKKRNVREKIQK